MEFDKSEVTIGRIPGNDIVLAKGNISKHHSRIVFKDNKFIVVDLKSTNGTYVNGKKIAAPQVLKSTDKVYIGDYILNVLEAEEGAQDDGGGDEGGAEEGGGEEGGYDERQEGGDERGRGELRGATRGGGEAPRPGRPPAPLPALRPRLPGHRPAERSGSPEEEEAGATAEEGPDEGPRGVHRRPGGRFGTPSCRRTSTTGSSSTSISGAWTWTGSATTSSGRRTEKAIQDIIEQMERDGELPEDVDRAMLLTDVLNEALGLGPARGVPRRRRRQRDHGQPRQPDLHRAQGQDYAVGEDLLVEPGGAGTSSSASSPPSAGASTSRARWSTPACKDGSPRQRHHPAAGAQGAVHHHPQVQARAAAGRGPDQLPAP